MSAPSLLYAGSVRLRDLHAAGVGRSRHQAKQRMRPDGPFAGSTGRIHSTTTEKTYWSLCKGYLLWARAHGYRHLADLDRDAHAVASAYLRSLVDAGRSPYALTTARSALRLFHQDRCLMADVTLPRRVRDGITRSRGDAISRGPLDLAAHARLIAFLRHTGLRRREVSALRVKHIRTLGPSLVIDVPKGKGGRPRTLTPLGTWSALDGPLADLIAGADRNALVFTRVPSRLRVQVLRRQFAQELYRVRSGLPLPHPRGRLVPGSYDARAAGDVAEALGHGRHRLATVMSHYLR